MSAATVTFELGALENEPRTPLMRRVRQRKETGVVLLHGRGNSWARQTLCGHLSAVTLSEQLAVVSTGELDTDHGGDANTLTVSVLLPHLYDGTAPHDEHRRRDLERNRLYAWIVRESFDALSATGLLFVVRGADRMVIEDAAQRAVDVIAPAGA